MKQQSKNRPFVDFEELRRAARPKELGRLAFDYSRFIFSFCPHYYVFNTTRFRWRLLSDKAPRPHHHFHAVFSRLPQNVQNGWKTMTTFICTCAFNVSEVSILESLPISLSNTIALRFQLSLLAFSNVFSFDGFVVSGWKKNALESMLLKRK